MSLYSISEFAERLGVSIPTLRNWHKTKKLIPTLITPGGHRYYSHEQYADIAKINNLSEDVLSGIVLITGATGSLGHALVKRIAPIAKKVICYSRCELKQANMQGLFSKYNNIRFFIGDVRDKSRLDTAMRGVDVVVHAAALKRIESCAYNPTEGINTNINGTINVAEACINNGIKKALFISSDKAAQPIIPYGYMKALGESCWVNFNNYSGKTTSFVAARYGNVINSRGSFYHIIEEQKKIGTICVTDPNMTRFYMTIEKAVDLNLYAIRNSLSGEIFVPKIKSASIMTFVEAFGGGCGVKIIGLRGVEKLSECLIADYEMPFTYENDNYYKIVFPHIKDPNVGWDLNRTMEKPIKPFKYTSDSSDVERYSAEDLRNMVVESKN